MPTKIQDMTSWGNLGNPTTSFATDSPSLPPGTSSLPPNTHSGQAPSSRLTADSTLARAGRTGPRGKPIGLPVGDRRWELRVVCDPAEAMAVQFDAVDTPFVAVHDIGGKTSKRFLAGVAAAMHSTVQTLTIRHQSYGNTLGTIEFVDLFTSDGDSRSSPPLRIFSTYCPEVDAKAAKQLADTLLGRSQLGVLLIQGELQTAALAQSIHAIKDACRKPTWRNRSLLLMPLKASETLTLIITRLGLAADIELRVAPTVARPVEAWNHLRSTWNSVTQAAHERTQSPLMLLPDPTSSTDGASMARRMARIADRVAAGKVTPEELRMYLEAPMHGDTDTSPATFEPLAPIVDHSLQLQPTSRSMPYLETVARAPAWSQTNHRVPTGLSELPTTSGLLDELAALERAATETPVQAVPSAQTRSTQAKATAAWPALATGAEESAVAVNAPGNHAAPPLAPTRVTADVAASTADAEPLQPYLDQCAQIKGMQACWVVDIQARRMVASRGVNLEAHGAGWASDGTRLANALRAAALALDLPGRVPEATLTYDEHHLIMRRLPHDPRLAFMAIVAKEEANAVVVQLKLQRLEAAHLPAPTTASGAAAAAPTRSANVATALPSAVAPSMASSMMPSTAQATSAAAPVDMAKATTPAPLAATVIKRPSAPTTTTATTTSTVAATGALNTSPPSVL